MKNRSIFRKGVPVQFEQFVSEVTEGMSDAEVRGIWDAIADFEDDLLTMEEAMNITGLQNNSFIAFYTVYVNERDNTRH